MQHPRLHSVTIPAFLALVLTLLGACAAAPDAPRLPFHVAVLPPTIAANELEVETATPAAVAKSSDLQFKAGEATLMQSLETSLAQRFVKVTMLPTPAGDEKPSPQDQIARARAVGADLILEPKLTHGAGIETATNGSIYFNLLFFAIGTPISYFVADRSYRCNVRLEAQVMDAGAAAVDNRNSKLAQPVTEHASVDLTFLQRADGVLPFVYSLVIPVGLLSKQTDSAASGAWQEFTEISSQSLADKLQSQRSDLLSPINEMVQFEPLTPRLTRDGGRSKLTGQVILNLLAGSVELERVRYRWSENLPMSGASFEDLGAPKALDKRLSEDRKLFEYQIDLGSRTSGFLQLEIVQVGEVERSRTFTYAVADLKVAD